MQMSELMFTSSVGEQDSSILPSACYVEVNSAKIPPNPELQIS